MNKTLRTKSSNNRIVILLMIIGLFALFMSGCGQLADPVKNATNAAPTNAAPSANSAAPKSNANTATSNANSTSPASNSTTTSASTPGNKGNGKVILVYNASELAPKSGDDVTTKIETGNGEYGMDKGFKYTSLEVRQGDKAMYFYYAANTPTTQDEINNKNAKVSGVCTNGKPFKTEDKITIQTQPAEGGGTDVTFTNPGKGCFSFIAK